MKSTTILAADLKVGSMRGRRQRVATVLHRPNGDVWIKVTTHGGGSTVETFKGDEFVRVYVKADA